MNLEPQVTGWGPECRPKNARLEVERIYLVLPLRSPFCIVRFDSQVRNANAQTVRELVRWCDWQADRMERDAAAASDVE